MTMTPCSRVNAMMLSVRKIWMMSLAFRSLTNRPGYGFAPGWRNVRDYELAKLWHVLYEPDRLRWWRARLMRFVTLRRGP